MINLQNGGHKKIMRKREITAQVYDVTNCVIFVYAKMILSIS